MYKVFTVIVTLVALTYGSYPQQLQQTSVDYDNAVLPYEEPTEELNQRPTPYNFGYRTDDGNGTKTTRQETGDEYGNVKGSYSYSTALGITRVVNYISDEKGFRVVVNTNEPGTITSAPANVVIKSTPITYSNLETYPVLRPTPTPSQNIAYTPVYSTSRPVLVSPPIKQSTVWYPTKSISQSPTPQPSNPATNQTPKWPVTYPTSNPTPKPTLSPTTLAAYPVSNSKNNEDYQLVNPNTYQTATSAPIISKKVPNRAATKSTKSNDNGARKTTYSSPAQNMAQIRSKTTNRPVISPNLYPTPSPTIGTQKTSAPAPLWSPTYPSFNPTRRPVASSGRLY